MCGGKNDKKKNLLIIGVKALNTILNLQKEYLIRQFFPCARKAFRSKIANLDALQLGLILWSRHFRQLYQNQERSESSLSVFLLLEFAYVCPDYSDAPFRMFLKTTKNPTIPDNAFSFLRWEAKIIQSDRSPLCTISSASFLSDTRSCSEKIILWGCTRHPHRRYNPSIIKEHGPH